MRKFLLHIICTVFCFVYALTLSAQNLGISTPGNTNYPQLTIGNTLTENSGNAGNYLAFDPVTIAVPLTAIAITTYGSASGNIKVSIYSDNSGNPGTKLFTEVAAAVTASTPSNITIPNTFLPPGNYWLAFDMNSSSSTANFVTKSTSSGSIRKYVALNYNTTFPNNPAVNNLTNQDHIALIGVPIEGYAKATKATLAVKTAFNTMNFYTHDAGNVRLAIYSDNGSGTAPSAKQWESGSITINTTGQPKLTTVNISSGTPATLTLNAGTYWLAWQWSATTAGPSYTAGSANTGNAIVQNYGAFPTSWTGGTASTENWTMYATFCTPPVASVNGQNNITCFAANDGTIVVSGSGGSGTITGFSVTNGIAVPPLPDYQGSPTFNGLAPGQYKIRVKDNIGCESKSIQ